jgi:CheY-like chemotaxis protein/two-component sensor histidine kinase
MERQLGQMVHLVDDLLDVSRITQGKLELRKTRMDLRTAVRNAVETSRALIDSGGHQLRVEVTDEPLWVDGDATRLTQVFANLLNNAAKFTEPLGRIMLTATVEGGEAVVRVTDSGVGIPKEMLPQIWESFVQGDRSLERARGGLGIGLTLVKRLLELHGGDIAAHSEGAGRGSEFIVRLPLTPAPETAPDHPVHLETPPAPTRRVLVVDDNHDAAESLVDLLETLGHESRMVFDGVAAVEAAAEYRPDLIILDLGLPKLNGYDACRRIREQTGKPRPAIAALTGWGQEEDRRRSQAAGFDVHLVKPLEIDVLQQMLRELPGPRPSSAQERE